MNAKLVSNVVRCLCSVVFLVTCSTSARTEAASYQKTDGTIVDPIRYNSSPVVALGNHHYSGNNLEPGAELTNASLDNAYLWRADLRGANLTDASLRSADLTNANLSFANLIPTSIRCPDPRLF